ncbi:hypothetical protein DENSPDRAFT_934680 [Dentipellis sp. KUC8613]|nr:hypothetical protein DENSPDRAFT_934680 [Dentipellis sp. KUC8613]
MPGGLGRVSQRDLAPHMMQPPSDEEEAIEHSLFKAVSDQGSQIAEETTASNASDSLFTQGTSEATEQQGRQSHATPADVLDEVFDKVNILIDKGHQQVSSLLNLSEKVTVDAVASQKSITGIRLELYKLMEDAARARGLPVSTIPDALHTPYAPYAPFPPPSPPSFALCRPPRAHRRPPGAVCARRLPMPSRRRMRPPFAFGRRQHTVCALFGPYVLSPCPPPPCNALRRPATPSTRPPAPFRCCMRPPPTFACHQHAVRALFGPYVLSPCPPPPCTALVCPLPPCTALQTPYAPAGGLSVPSARHTRPHRAIGAVPAPSAVSTRRPSPSHALITLPAPSTASMRPLHAIRRL